MKHERGRDEKLAEARREAIASGRAAAWGVQELAVTHGISPGHVRNAIRRGELKASKLGRRVVITDADVQAWLTAHLIQTPDAQTAQGS